MKFKTLSGKDKFLNVEKTRIKWNEPSLSKFQESVKNFLYPYWAYHVVYEEMPVAGTKMRMDFYNATKRIAIECDGKQHDKYNKFFHSGNRYNYFNQIKRDNLKYLWCVENGILLVNVEPQDLPLDKEFFKKHGVFL